MRLAIAAMVLLSTLVRADPYDFRVYQLGNPSTHPEANNQFRTFTRELAAGLTSVNLMPPETLGHAAFAVNAELAVVSFRTSQFNLPTEGRYHGPMLVPSAHIRKGLPFSLEAGMRMAWVEKSRMAAGTGELKWALNEGYSYLPDVGVRAYATKLVNTRDFDLFSTGLDLGLGKQFAVGGMITLTPYVGYNTAWTAAWSRNIDFDPERTAAASNASATAQLQNTNTFDEVHLLENTHSRIYGGLRFVGGVVQLGAEVSCTSLSGLCGISSRAKDGKPDLVTVNSTVGLDF